MAGEEEKCIHAFGEDTRGKEPYGRHKRRWKDKTEMYLQKTGWGRGRVDRDVWRAFVDLRLP